MTPEEINKLEKKIEKRRKLTKKYQIEKTQNYENNDVRNETIAHIINNKDELIIKRNKKCLDYYYKNKDELDKKRKTLDVGRWTLDVGRWALLSVGNVKVLQ